MKKNKSIPRFFYVGLLALLSSGIFFACHHAPDDKRNNESIETDSVSAPVIIKAGKFAVNNTDTLPPPTVAKLSQRPAPVKTRARFHVTMQTFNTEDGLALSSLFIGYKDRAGNLWFGTSGNGVSKYDGKSFTNYTSANGLIHNLVEAITEDRKGNMWFGTYGGVSKYNGVTFQNFTTQQGLPDNDVYVIVEDTKGRMWIGTHSGLSRYTPQNSPDGKNLFINYTAADGLAGGTIAAIFEDRNGNLWVGGSGGIFKYNPAAEARGKKAFEKFSNAFGV